MSLVLLESGAPTWVAGLVTLIAMMILLAVVRSVGKSRPHE